MRGVLLCAACALVLLVAAPAGAQEGGGVDELLRASTKPMFFTFGAGPTFFALNGQRQAGPNFRLPNRRRGRVGFDFGYHFSGDGTGPAIGAVLESSFDDKFWVFNPGFKFWYDIQVTDWAIYVAPLAKVSYALGVCYKQIDCSRFDRLGHAFDLGLGLEGRVVLDDAWMLYLRPAQVDILLGDFFQESAIVSYSLLVGGGLTFD